MKNETSKAGLINAGGSSAPRSFAAIKALFYTQVWKFPVGLLPLCSFYTYSSWQALGMAVGFWQWQSCLFPIMCVVYLQAKLITWLMRPWGLLAVCVFSDTSYFLVQCFLRPNYGIGCIGSQYWYFAPALSLYYISVARWCLIFRIYLFCHFLSRLSGLLIFRCWRDAGSGR